MTTEPTIEFASLTAADSRTRRAMHGLLDALYDQGDNSDRFTHHRRFVRYHAGDLSATRSPSFSPEQAGASSDVTTEADRSDDEEASPDTAPCYVLLFESQLKFSQNNLGLTFGTGDRDRFPDHAGVDFLLPPSETTNQLYARHGHFAFDSKYGRLWLHARHKGIRVDDRPLAPGKRILAGKRARISIGPYRFIFEFKVSDEEEFQKAKREYLAEYSGVQVDPFEATSATPSTNDVRIQDWVFHGIVGASAMSLIHAASNVRSGETAAVKRLRVDSTNAARDEISLYDSILESTSSHRYSKFLMHKHSVLSTSRAFQPYGESYLLWKPLARKDFSEFGLIGRWHNVTRESKLKLFVQVLLGLSALHSNDWIHRDLKPANLGVVEIGGAEEPYAVVIDLAQCIRRGADPGHTPRVSHAGTVGYLAPELENAVVAPTYDKGVDIWSMGAVAYYTFIGGSIPWSRRYNMFVPEREAKEPSLKIFRDVRTALLRNPEDSLECLVGKMLDEDPRTRPDIDEVLGHVSLRAAREEIEGGLEGDKSAGMKRPARADPS